MTTEHSHNYDDELESDFLDHLRQSNSPVTLSNLSELLGVNDEKELIPIIEQLSQKQVIFVVNGAYALKSKSYNSLSDKSESHFKANQSVSCAQPTPTISLAHIRAPPPHILLQQHRSPQPRPPPPLQYNHSFPTMNQPPSSSNLHNIPPSNAVIPNSKPLRGLMKLYQDNNLPHSSQGKISSSPSQKSISTATSNFTFPSLTSNEKESQTRPQKQECSPCSDNASAPKRVRTPAEVMGVPEPVIQDHRSKLMPNLSEYHKEQPGMQLSGQVANMNTLNNEFFNTLNKNPVSTLFEFAQQRGLNCSIDVMRTYGPPHRPKMEMVVTIGQRKFPSVTVTNKKDGKREAADAALRILLAEGVFSKQEESVRSTSANDKSAGQGDQSNLYNMNGTEFDRCAALTHSKFVQLVGDLSRVLSKHSNANMSINLAGRKVLAGIVMRDSKRPDWETVISLGTGNRCITGNAISVQGFVVNDSHAEIVSRRGLIRFFYKEILKLLIGKQSSDVITFNPDYADASKHHAVFNIDSNLTSNQTADNEHRDAALKQSSLPAMFRLRDGLSLHLYISTAPCGDGALFSPRDKASQSSACLDKEQHSPIFDNAVQGLLRTKIEFGEGTIPVEMDAPRQTLDGIMRGERLKTMSCSDKIMRWNFLGLQGSLLSHYLEPVYLSSLTLGYLFDPGHLSRAVCCRLERAITLECPRKQLENANLLDPPSPYRVNHPKLGRVTACEPQRETNKTNELSINWCLGDDLPEVVNGTTGQCLEKVEGYPKVSRLSKAHLFSLFREVVRTTSRTDLNVDTYQKAKKASVNYQLAKRHMFARLKVLKLGKWMSKPNEEEMFAPTN